MPLPSACLALVLLAAAPAAQDAARYDLTTVLPVDEPLLIEIEGEAAGSVTIKVGGAEPLVQTTEQEQSRRMVDHFERIDGEGDYTATRRIVHWHDSNDGVPTEGPLTDLTLRFEAGDEISLHLEDDKGAPEELLQGLLDLDISLGLALGFEAPLAVGEACSLDMLGMATLLTFPDAVVEATGHFTLAAVDERRGSATLEGTLHAETITSLDSLDLDSVYSGDCTLVLGLEGGLVRRLEWRGESTTSGSAPGLDASGRVAFSQTLTMETGKAARRARSEAAAFRDVPRSQPGMPVTLTLPSHWFDVPQDDGTWLYRSDALGGVVVVEIAVFEAPGDVDDMIEAVEEGILEGLDDRKAKGRNVGSGLGRGRSLEFVSEETPFVVDLLPAGDDAIARVRWFGDDVAMDALRKDLNTLRKTFDLAE